MLRNSKYRSNTARYHVTTPLITPFYRPIIGKDQDFENVPAPQKNYTPYDLFCFKTKFERFLYQHAPTYHFTFSLKIDGSINRMCIDLYEGSKFISLSNNNENNVDDNKFDASFFQRGVDESVQIYPSMCLLFDISELITSETSEFGQIPPSWVSSLLPFFTLSSHSENNVDDNVDGYIVSNGKMYIDLSKHPTDYSDIYKMYQLELNRYIVSYFKRGVIVCSSLFQKSFIENWSLKKIHDQSEKNTSDEIKEYGFHLYEPMWSDERFAPERISFLYDRMQNVKWMRIYVGDNYVRRHFIVLGIQQQLSYLQSLISKDNLNFLSSQQSTTLDFAFSGVYVYVPVGKTPEDCSKITDVIYESQQKSEGKVHLMPIDNPKDEIKIQENIKSLYQGIDFGDRIVSYQQFDQPKYIVSFLIPDNLANDSLKILERR